MIGEVTDIKSYQIMHNFGYDVKEIKCNNLANVVRGTHNTSYCGD